MWWKPSDGPQTVNADVTNMISKLHVTEVIVYTDGYFPDRRKGQAEEPRIGGVAFSKDRNIAIATSEEIPGEIMDLWIPRETQIVMVEAIALPVAAETFRTLLRSKRVIWLVDSDAVLGAAIKRHSAR